MTRHEEGLPEWAAMTSEAYRRAVESLYYEVYRCPSYPPSPLPDGAHQAWFMPSGGIEWEPLGYIAPTTGTVYVAHGPGEVPVVTMPCQHSTIAGFTTTVEASLTGDLRALFDALTAAHSADLDRRLLRLADDLGRWEPRVRLEWHQVLQILEDAGVADGYGRLTIPQPVRPPIEPPATNGQP
ncbi:hypothetical protein AB0C80_18335 [Streptomyces anthocyanicus]|uniref:hypothetical protein n=1 Tax=Streptomyces anthocyanicus TaxID=68174 RepID=UPI0033C6339D